ncbi:MAG: DUF2806 domain-containing protein [Candidatus Symbiobacter sp.]|nr:DUF2806 domain-containing protein [Candidatus Symbiobacter sp.]
MVNVPSVNFSPNGKDVLGLGQAAASVPATVDSVSGLLARVGFYYPKYKELLSNARLIESNNKLQIAKNNAEIRSLESQNLPSQNLDSKSSAFVINGQIIQLSDVAARGLLSSLTENEFHQINREAIIDEAINHINQDAKPDDVNSDFLSDFLDKTKNVSEPSVRKHWAKLFAGEINKPGSFSKRTLNILLQMDQQDAIDFANLCNFVVYLALDSNRLKSKEIPQDQQNQIQFSLNYIDEKTRNYIINLNQPRLLILDSNDHIYMDNGINYNTIQNLSVLGLIKFDPLAGFTARFDKDYLVHNVYFDKSISYYLHRKELIYPPPDPKYKDYPVEAEITRTGLELFQLVERKPIEGFLDYYATKIPELHNQIL